MKKNVTITLLFFVLCSMTQAQNINFGIKSGLNYSNFIGKGNIDSQYKPGFHLGVFTEIPLKGSFSFHPELLYSSQGYKLSLEILTLNLNDPNLNSGNQKGKVVLNNILVPLITRYNFSDKLNLELGPQLGFLLNSVSNFNLNRESIRESGNFQFTYGATVGMGFDPSDRLKLQLRYYLGLKNFFDEVFRESEFEKRYSFESVLQLSLGYVIF